MGKSTVKLDLSGLEKIKKKLKYYLILTLKKVVAN